MNLDDFLFAGPGSRPPDSDGASMRIARLPTALRTHAPPRIHPPHAPGRTPAVDDLLSRIAAALDTHDVSHPPLRFDISGCVASDQDLLNQVMGEGEVSIRVGDDVRIQESVLAGLWRVVRTRPDGGSSDWIEVGAAPGPVPAETFAGAAVRADDTPPARDEDVMNAPPLLAEINGRLEQDETGTSPAAPHVVDLTLLPVTDGDLLFLQKRLGPGRTTILSRGYGNCRMTSTGTRHVWWVRYFNSRDELMLNNLEITPIPQGACAAEEDLRDSGRRLREILEALR